VAIDRKNRIIYVKQGMWGYNHGTRELYDKVKAVVKPREVVIADSSEKRLIADMKGLGLNIRKVVKGDGSVLAGIKTMQDYKIVVSPESTEIGKELNNYAWKANGVPIDAYNHWIDAIRYYVQTFVNPSRLGGGNKAL
jgi:phage terminase large subunit